MSKGKQRQKHPAHKPDNGGGGDPTAKIAKPSSVSKPASSQHHSQSRHRFQITLLLSIVVALSSFVTFIYWDEIIQGTALIVATVKALYRPVPKPTEYLLGDTGLPKAHKKSKYPRSQPEFIDPNSASLHKKFALDFRQVQRIRLHNMKKYSFNYSVYGIDRRANLSLQEFRDVYDGKWPVLITDVIPKWPASMWTGEYFAAKFPNDRATMKAVDEQHPENNQNLGITMKLFYDHINDVSPKQWTYIGDEIFIPMRPELYNALEDIPYLEEDFYKLFPAEIRPWNAMMLWGTANSHSSFHMDPYNWSGTNAVLWGTKRWKMYPPGQDDYFYVMRGVHSHFPLDCLKYNSELNAYDIDYVEYPKFTYGSSVNFDQHAGELLLLPTGWYHQVYNLEETFAISSQWMNRNNYRVILEEIFTVNKQLRALLPDDVDSYSPEEKVKAVFENLPKDILQKGRDETWFLINQLKLTQDEMDQKGYHLPFNWK